MSNGGIQSVALGLRGAGCGLRCSGCGVWGGGGGNLLQVNVFGFWAAGSWILGGRGGLLKGTVWHWAGRLAQSVSRKSTTYYREMKPVNSHFRIQHSAFKKAVVHPPLNLV